jgi:hypothetical protein
MDLTDIDVITGLASFAVTLLVLSYLIGDNPLYRIAVYLFVGAAAGFIALTVAEWLWNFWVQRVVLDQDSTVGQRLLGVAPLVIGLMLLFKFSPTMARLGNLAIAYLVGVGTAVALNGIIVGTLLPQVRAAGDVPGISADVDGWLNGLIMAIGTICTLLYFQFLARRKPTGEVVRPLLLRIAAAVGQGFIVVTLASLYAGAIITSLSIFAGRTAEFVTQFIK